MPENTDPPERGPITDTHSDVILNDETRRALREWRRRLYAGGAGVLAAIVLLIPTAATALWPIGVPFHLAVVLVSSLSLPVVASYVAVRTYGLSHHEVVCAASQAAREAAVATATLDAHQRAEQPSEAIVTDATPSFADIDTDTDTDKTQ